MRAEVSEMMPGIMNQLGPDNMKDLRKMMGAVRNPAALPASVSLLSWEQIPSRRTVHAAASS